METVEYDVKDFNSRYAADQGMYARFYTQPKKDEEASLEAGRPIFQDVVFVEIMAAGSPNNIVRRKATSEDRERFARQYAMFQQGSAEQTIGTPLAEVTWLTKSQVEELAYFKIRTLENLGSLSDEACNKIPGLYDLKRKAAAFIEKAAESAPVQQLTAELDQSRNEIETLKNLVREQSEALKTLKEEMEAKGKK